MRKNVVLEHIVLGIFFVAPILFRTGVAQEQQPSSCIECHEDVKEEFETSIHSHIGIQCVDCHGGNPGDLDPDRSMARSAGFRGDYQDDQPPFTKRETVEMCASCHADRKRMKPFGIPTDQFDQYKTSQHGMALYRKGDEHVAACIDCHGNHDILPPSDPKSRVYLLNIPQMCANCHSDEALMKLYDLSTDSYQKYIGSVHGVALLERGERGAPECARCHGAHGAMPPGVTEVSSVCGQCHRNTRDYFNRSPHKKAMDEKLIKECVSCHNHHAISASSQGMFDTICIKCHEEGTWAYEHGQKIKAILVEAEGRVADVLKDMERAEVRGIDIDTEKGILEEAKTNLIQALPVQHTLSVIEVERYTTKAKSVAQEVDSRIQAIFSSQRRRRWALGGVWVFILFTVLILYGKKRQADRESRT